MSAEEDQLREIFSQAVTKPTSEEREHYLVAACGQNAELRRQVDSLLLAHAEAGGFLDRSVLDGSQPIGEGPGSVIGRYKLLQQIGEGGFGVVFMAEQQEPIRRMVALKILKAGMDTKEVVARFEAERQALALMDHPNIARVLDAGTTESGDRTAGCQPAVPQTASLRYDRTADCRSAVPQTASLRYDAGRPYFVMDLVKGVPITEFCEQHQLPIQARLELFLKVCAGVQHAHQKGVIHRDLKPSNVLVVHEPGQPGEPKVIDFGIAKALGQKLTERTLFTRFEQLLGTPAYMSPEQAEWSGVDLDTRTDLYALGVLLYELLTGTTPLEKETLARAAFDEMRRMIREVEPPKPSTRLTALVAADVSRRKRGVSDAGDAPADGSADSRRRLLEAKERLPSVRGDLDWIVMKCLEKDRGRRYETVNGLARDLERHLHGEPVVACPPSKAYRARKFLGKHRVAVGAATGIALALVTGLGLALAGWLQANRAGEEAQEQTDVAKAVNKFLVDDLLGYANPEFNPNFNPKRDVRLREVLDRAGERIEDRFTNRPAVEAAIRIMLGRAYMALGEHEAEEKHIRRGFEIAEEKLGADSLETIHARVGLMGIYARQGRWAEAVELARKNLEAADRRLSPDDGDWFAARLNLGTIYLDSSPPQIEKADEILRDLWHHAPRMTQLKSENTNALALHLGRVYDASKRYREASKWYGDALQRLQREGTVHSIQLLRALNHLAWDHIQLGDDAQALELLHEARQRSRQLLGSDHPNTVDQTKSLAYAHARLGAWAPYIELHREATRSAHRSPGPNDPYFGAVFSLVSGDTNAYREFASELVARCVGTTNAADARMVTEACLLAPDLIPDLDVVFKLAELIPRDSANDQDRLARGMAEYRCGRLREALELFQPVLESYFAPLAAQAGYLCALIHHQLGDPAAAHAELAQAAKRLAPALRTGQIVGFPARAGYVRAVAIRVEAERLILGREVSPRPDSAWLAAAREQWEPVRRLVNEGDDLAGLRKWAQARDRYLAAMREPVFDWESAALDKDPLSFANKFGAVFLLAGDEANYTNLCARLRIRAEEYPESGHHAAAALQLHLLRNAATGDRSEHLIAGWLQRPASDRSFAPTKLAQWHAMAAFRSGRYQETIEQSDLATKSPALNTRATAQLFRAMALARLGRAGAAKKELAQAEVGLGQHLINMTGDCWDCLAACQVVLEEARRVVAAAR